MPKSRASSIRCAQFDDTLAHHGYEAPRNRLDALGVAFMQNDEELVRGKAADAVLAAQRAGETAADDGDHLVADVEPLGLVD